MSGYLKTSCQGCEKALFNCHTSSVNQPFLWQKASRPWCPWKSAMRVWLVPHFCDFLKTFLWKTLRVFSFLVLQTSSNEQSSLLQISRNDVSGVVFMQKWDVQATKRPTTARPGLKLVIFRLSGLLPSGYFWCSFRLRALQVIQAGLWVSWPTWLLPQKTDTLETWDAFGWIWLIKDYPFLELLWRVALCLFPHFSLVHMSFPSPALQWVMWVFLS